MFILYVSMSKFPHSRIRPTLKTLFLRSPTLDTYCKSGRMNFEGHKEVGLTKTRNILGKGQFGHRPQGNEQLYTMLELSKLRGW